MNEPFLIYAIGFLAQIFFSARTLLQWIKSEKVKAVVSPSSYWILSISGSYLLCLYGWFREDFSIILGQFLSYYIYLYNLYLKGLWKKFGFLLKMLLVATPVVAAVFALKDFSAFTESFFRNEDVPVGLLVFGSAGQIMFTLRFVYQWVSSMKRHESVLPAGFWIISLAGSALIISYGIFRADPVLILGQSFGFVAYLRNLVLYFRSRSRSKENELC